MTAYRPARARMEGMSTSEHRPARIAALSAAAAIVAGLLGPPATAQLAVTELNLANQAELEQLQPIGPQLSGRILEERQRHGPFADWRDVQRRLKGVGPATARRLSDGGLRVQGQPWAPPAPGSASPPAPPAAPASASSILLR